MKVPRVGLLHFQAILAPFENHDLISGVKAGANKVSLLLHIHPGAPLPTHTKPSCLLLIRVVVGDQRQPQSLDVLLQVEVGRPVLLPLHRDLELELDGMSLY